MTELALIDTQLFVYGTLAPGRANEHQLDGLEGTWVQARVRGFLLKRVGALRRVSLESGQTMKVPRCRGGCFDPEI